jgi:hypothetical protein
VHEYHVADVALLEVLSGNVGREHDQVVFNVEIRSITLRQSRPPASQSVAPRRLRLGDGGSRTAEATEL